MISSLIFCAALASTDVVIYKINPQNEVISEDRGTLVEHQYVAGELLVAYIPERIFQNGFD